MASTYTTNLGIEKIATGEQSGSWGTTTNTNFDIVDQAVNGIVAVVLSSAGSSGSPTSLPITDGSASNGRNKFIEFTDGGDLSATAFVQLTPIDAEKIVIMRNSLTNARSVIVFQGTYNASNDFEIPNGKDVVLKFSGTGSGSTVTQVFVNFLVTTLDATTGNVTTVNATTVNATTTDLTNIEVTNIKAKDGTAAGSIANSTGVVTLGSTVLTTTDINGGSVDGVTIGTNAVATDIRVDNLKLDANKVESTNTNGNLQVEANGTGYLEIRGNTNPGKLRFNCESNSHGVTLSGPPHSASATYALELPNADGSSGQALVTNGSGKLSFASAGISTGKAIAMAIVFG